MTITRDSILGWIKAYDAAVATHEDLITKLDSSDADHGANKDRGLQTVSNDIAIALICYIAHYETQSARDNGAYYDYHPR